MTEVGVIVTPVMCTASVNLYCAVCAEVAPVAVIRNFTPPSLSCT